MLVKQNIDLKHFIDPVQLQNPSCILKIRFGKHTDRTEVVASKRQTVTFMQHLLPKCSFMLVANVAPRCCYSCVYWWWWWWQQLSSHVVAEQVLARLSWPFRRSWKEISQSYLAVCKQQECKLWTEFETWSCCIFRHFLSPWIFKYDLKWSKEEGKFLSFRASFLSMDFCLSRVAVAFEMLAQWIFL